MSLIYAVIARGTDTTLVDYEAKHSNFPKLAKTLLTKIKQNNRQTYLYNQKYSITPYLLSYYFHYINQDDFTFLCLTDKIFPKRSAFAFLEEIKSIFQDRYDLQTRTNAINYAMAETFTEFLKAKMVRSLFSINF